MERFKLYDLCLKKTYKNDKIDKILPSLFKIIELYHNSEKKEDLAVQRELTIELIKIFEDLINRVDPEDFNETVDLLISLDVYPTQFTECLSVIYDRRSITRYENEKVGYYKYFELMCDKADNLYRIHRLEDLLNNHSEFKKYLVNVVNFYQKICTNDNEIWEKRWFFGYYVNKITAYCYKKGYDSDTIFNILSCIDFNYPKVITYFELNGGDNYSYRIISVDQEESLFETTINHFYRQSTGSRIIS